MDAGGKRGRMTRADKSYTGSIGDEKKKKKG